MNTISRRVLCAAACLWTAPALAGTTWIPAEDDFGHLLFEDRWPCAGDADFNDAVIRYHAAIVDDGTQDTRIQLDLSVHALGAELVNGLALRIPGLAVSDVAGVQTRLGTAGSTDGAPWDAPTVPALPGSGDLSLVLADDLRADLCGGTGGFLNTVGGTAVTACRPLTVEIDLQPGVAVSRDAPWDLYLFRTGDPGHQIHRPSFYGDGADPGLYNTCDDVSDASTGSRWYVLSTPTPDLPVALHIPTGTDAAGDPLDAWPLERVRIDQAMPRIVPWLDGQSGYDDWYETDTRDLYGAAPPAPVYRAVWGSCVEVRDAGRPSGVYTVDVDGTGPLPAIETACEVDDWGGGWMLVARRDDGVARTRTTDLSDRTLHSQVLPDDVWSELRSTTGEMRAITDAGDARLDMAAMRSANCGPLSTSLASALLAHQEASGCDTQNTDYDLLGISDENRISEVFDCRGTFTLDRRGMYCTSECCWTEASTTQTLWVR